MATVVSFSELASFGKKKKKEFLRFLNEKGIKTKSWATVVAFEVALYEGLPLFSASSTFGFSSDFLATLSYDTPEQGSAYFDAIYRDMVSRYGIPTTDNSHHHRDEVYVRWIKDLGVSLQKSDSTHNIEVTGKFSEVKRPSHLNSWTWILIGLAWGFVMFFTMGRKYGYGWGNLLIWIVGGLICGFLFGLSTVFSPFRRKIITRKLPDLSLNPSEIRKIECFKQERGLESIPSILCISSRRSPRRSSPNRRELVSKTSIFFLPDTILFLFLNDGKTTFQQFSNSEVENFSVRLGLSLWFRNKSFIVLHSVDNPEVLQRHLYRILGVDDEKLTASAEIINRCLLEYDMDGWIKGGAPKDFYGPDSKDIALTLGPHPEDKTHEEILFALLSAYFEEEDPLGDWTVIAHNIEKKLKESGLSSENPAE